MRRACVAAGGKDRHKMTCVIDLGTIALRHLSSGTLAVLKKRIRLEEVRPTSGRVYESCNSFLTTTGSLS
jgi:hypothetical protein